ncbi:hypothetical protein LR48_Vigan11g082000 [Vigna angularis]|uniref:Uncharacterized protein n=2 Tax=Phaseolus angularis TaxID=3914 RepID=A0A0L9VSD0_PHAAN|nr:uncharacterized protein LOC108347332 [Vigna angularis]KAG2411014.1 uncharacterized protein HKW66_Vig0016790 [Vigna angularis]KOM57787.1 hypothetical protein LR48_Vigan11g082000 [Vigna angularis]BAT72816.1 hypothetical protein VIGAN_01025400 [Vigna angularis var. angularis]
MFSSLLTLLIYTLLRVTLSFLAPITAQAFVPSDSMDIKGWRNSGKRAIHLGRCHREIEHVHSLSATVAPKLRWKLLWMKIKKEKKRLFQSASFQVPYDQHTYSQNFDQGTALDEPDNLSRSFSVRFADPSIVFVTRKG